MYVVINPKIIPRTAVKRNVGAFIIAIKNGERQKKLKSGSPFLNSSFGNARGMRTAERIVSKRGIIKSDRCLCFSDIAGISIVWCIIYYLPFPGVFTIKRNAPAVHRTDFAGGLLPLSNTPSFLDV